MRDRVRQQNGNTCGRMIGHRIREKEVIRYRKSMRNKVCIIALGMIMMIAFCGCSLAVEDAGEAKEIPQDRLIGAFITTEYLDLFDMEAYLNDHADELVDGIVSGDTSDGEVIDGMSYNDRIYATVDKHGSKEPSDWEVSFGDMEGICFFDAKWQNEGEEPFTMITCGDEICDVKSHYSVFDEGESIELTGTLYALVGGEMSEIGFFLNPVYQTETGEIYVTSGMGHYATGDGVGSFSSSLSEETTLEENGEKMTNSSSITVNYELCVEPEMLYIYQMDETHQILHQEEFIPGTLPEQLTVDGEAAYILVETIWADGTVSRELFESEEENSMYIETFYKVNDTALGKQGTEVIWE